jgi:hypothetical protein
MDEWRQKLARNLVAQTPAGFLPGAAASLEIALGIARSELAYVIELARAHRIPATGNVAGDDVWMRLGEARVRATLNRREGVLAIAREGHDDVRLSWDEGKRAMVGTDGAPADVRAMVRDAIDALVSTWQTAGAKRDSDDAPNSDHPTKS